MDTPLGRGTGTIAEPAEIDRRELRQTMGRFCTGVTVITAYDAGPVGFTCQSFISLSLDPPLVMFSAKSSSRSLPRIRQAGAFSTNILGRHQESLGRRLGRSDPDKFRGVPYYASERTGAPHLAGAIAWIDAEVTETRPGGDHTIVIGQVLDLHCPPDVDDPLLFFGGEFVLPAISRPE